MKYNWLFYLIGLFSIAYLISCDKKVNVINLVPETPSMAPDYFCTWNLQGYVVSFSSNEEQRKAMNEENMFGEEQYQNWTSLYPRIQEDVFFVMDDSWDIPLDLNSMSDNPYLGYTVLDTTRFPSFNSAPFERLKKLVQQTEDKGWKGLGGWVCAQESSNEIVLDSVQYWIERLMVANAAGFDYWKVDWGENSGSIEWRRMLTYLGREYAPTLWIEHAQDEKYVAIGDVYRTYDVFNVVAQPATINRVAQVLKYKPEKNAKGLINCEDEPYIAAALGCTIGIMRHSFNGPLPNGQQDFVFPPVGRDLKNSLDEIVRGVRWHRIAQPFGIGESNYTIDDETLEDYWVLEENESWCTWCNGHQPGDTLSETAPARISRGLPLPEVLDKSPQRPFVLSSQYPNGAIAIATIGRGLDHTYISKEVEVKQEIESLSEDIGIFGYYKKLTFILPDNIDPQGYKVYGQDLLAKQAIDISADVEFKDNTISFSSQLIKQIGTQAASEGDVSPPGLVVRFVKK